MQALKSLFNKSVGLMVRKFIKKKKLRHRRFPVSFPKFLKKTDFLEHVRTNAWVKWKKIVFTKAIHRKIPVMTSFLVQLQTCGLTDFSKRDSITDAFLWKLWRFTEYHFYRALLRDCFWFSCNIFTESLALSVINQFSHN